MTAETKEKKLPEINVVRDKANLVTIGFKGELSVKVYPGNNRIKDQEVLKAIADPKINGNWKAFIDNKVHKIVTGESKDKTEKTTSVFTAMKADDAITTVRETLSIPALEAMRADESAKGSRKTVLAAIEDQIKELDKPITQEDANK